AEEVVLTFNCPGEFRLGISGETVRAERTSDGTFTASFNRIVVKDEWIPLEVELMSGPATTGLTVSWHTSEDARSRPLPPHRMFLPWAVREPSQVSAGTSLPPEVVSAKWLQGRRIFFGDKAACFTCHRIRGEGHLVGPDLSNLVHRDYT